MPTLPPKPSKKHKINAAVEPFEILKKAGEQISGVSEKKVSDNVRENPQVTPKLQEQKGRVSNIQAFQNELVEIKRLQDIRERERQELRLQEEAQKEQVVEQKKKNNPFVEIAGKIKRGMLGGGAMLGIKRKQRSAELTKTPSN